MPEMTKKALGQKLVKITAAGKPFYDGIVLIFDGQLSRYMAVSENAWLYLVERKEITHAVKSIAINNL